ncbi:hypothetical protein DH2020_024889 [Rehmannia glutinosa]|uniref:Reverse transcriptase zinc-binding domain-containing protein n=1 Tax=Rehmannia glutinosa TaxID=99300 RepID=A0ABR0W537_REHGL
MDQALGRVRTKVTSEMASAPPLQPFTRDEVIRALKRPNTSQEIRNCITSILNIPEVVSHGKYLGLPSVVGANKQQIFSNIVDRAWSKLQGWKEMHLSQAGRLILIQSVIQSIPTFAMSCFRIPDYIIDKLQSMMAHFLWSGNPEKRSIHWRSWDKLCRSKASGGLGLRHLKAFNLALLCKQSWRILTCPTSLLAHVFKAKYFPRGDLMTAQIGHRPSWSWRSIFASLKCLKLGSRKQIRSGMSTKIWTDPWITCHSDFLIHTPRPQSSSLHTVADLIDNDLGLWNIALVRSTFSTAEAKSILALPISRSHGSDTWCWHFSKQGKYTVKTAYHAILENALLPGLVHSHASSSCGVNPVWKKIWKLRIPHRTQLFFWRCLSQSVATFDNLQLHHLESSDPCCFCDHHSPTSAHIFFTCSFAAASWKLAGIWELIMKFEQPSASLWLQDILLHFDQDICELVAIMCDFIWLFRNKKKWEATSTEPYMVALLANNKILDYRASHLWPERPSLALISPCLIPRQPSGPCIFFDGAISSSNNCAGIGVAAFDPGGRFICGVSKRFYGIQNSEVAEMLALKEALSLGKDLNLSLVEIFGDAAAIILAINGDTLFPASCAVLCDDVLDAKSLVSLGGIFWTKRANNSVAHFFSLHAKNMFYDSFVWDALLNHLCQSLLDDFQHP